MRTPACAAACATRSAPWARRPSRPRSTSTRAICSGCARSASSTGLMPYTNRKLSVLVGLDGELDVLLVPLAKLLGTDEEAQVGVESAWPRLAGDEWHLELDALLRGRLRLGAPQLRKRHLQGARPLHRHGHRASGRPLRAAARRPPRPRGRLSPLRGPRR